jgi:methanogenic corrinoid protein MtbC1
VSESPEARESRVSELSRAYAAAVLSGDEVAAELVVRDAIDAKLSAGEVDDEIIAPALWLIGELWARGDITVADEHLATEISIRVLALHGEARRTALARRDHRVLLATPSGELHSVALRMADRLLREAGYGVVMLGPDVPGHALAAKARQVDPDVICLSATMPGGGDRVLITIHEVSQACPRARFVVGGKGVGPRVRGQPGLHVCERVSEVVEAVDALVKRAELN